MRLLKISIGLEKNISREAVEKSIKNLCFGVYEDKKQIGFARVISDYATSALLKDILILESHRGQGLGKYLVKYILEYPELGFFVETRYVASQSVLFVSKKS